jgi:hypothetical protein
MGRTEVAAWASTGGPAASPEPAMVGAAVFRAGLAEIHTCLLFWCTVGATIPYISLAVRYGSINIVTFTLTTSLYIYKRADASGHLHPETQE